MLVLFGKPSFGSRFKTTYSIPCSSQKVRFSGLSPSSDPVDTLTKPGDPVLYTIDTSNINQTYVTIYWSTVPGIVNDYQIDVSTTDFNMVATLLPGYPITVDKADTSINIGKDAGTATLNAGTWYWFKLRSRNNSGESEDSNYDGVITVPADPIATPASGITDNSFETNWKVQEKVWLKNQQLIYC